jgi:hypothetical protein
MLKAKLHETRQCPSCGWALLRVREQGVRTRRARRPCGLIMLHDDGVRRLAIAVLQQAVMDLQGPIPEYRRCAAAFMARREDFDEFWCALVGLHGDAVRERLDHQEAA